MPSYKVLFSASTILVEHEVEIVADDLEDAYAAALEDIHDNPPDDPIEWKIEAVTLL